MANVRTTGIGGVQARHTMVIAPNPTDTWDIWGDDPSTRWVGYGGDTSVLGDAYFPVPGYPQGALIVYVNNQPIHVFTPKEQFYTVTALGDVSLGPNDGGPQADPFSDNQGFISVNVIVVPFDEPSPTP